MENIPHDDLPLSDDPEENLRMQNEILRLKLKAELGAEPHRSGNLPPEIENEFLKNVVAFEHSAAGAKQVTVYQLLEKPVFEPSDNLDDEAVGQALEKITAFLASKQIVVDFSGEYDSRTKYKFITEELFEHETDDMSVPGMFMHFNYEEFHPNHKLDIENRAMEFISGWFERNIGEDNWALADQFILPNGTTMSKKEIAEKLKNVFDSYITFTECNYDITDINFELNKNTGMGYAEGAVKYIAVTENHENIPVEGPFKLYFSMDFEWWGIFYFVFPGMKYEV